jgi:hypothetical protein
VFSRQGRSLKKAPADRRYFPLIPVPANRGDIAGEETVRANIVHLFSLVLGLEVEPDDEEVHIVWRLWSAARQTALDEIADDPLVGGQISAHCRSHGSTNRRGGAGLNTDPQGQIRAWMTVMSYLMFQPELLQR